MLAIDYQETLDWMFARLPMYQREGAAAYKENLDNIEAFAEYLGYPERRFKSVHVAGTNGKGSTSHMLASVLQEAGYRTGLYTSPHLKDFRERIRLDGIPVEADYVLGFIKEHCDFIEKNGFSFFELTVAMAFDFFAEKKVDIAIVEVGLGGRLDATNIILPEVSVITNIGLDHTRFLGNTLVEIAAEKAGIIKEGIPVIIGERQPETEQVFKDIAIRKNAPLHFAEDWGWPFHPSDLKGSYQVKNQRTVLQTLEILRGNGFEITEENILKGLSKVSGNTGLLGRWQVLGAAPAIICDSAHNREGLELVINQLLAIDHDRLHMVLGVVSDKDLDTILPLFPRDATYYFCKPDVPRGLDGHELAQTAKGYGLDGQVYDSVAAALSKAKNEAGAKDLIFVGGSTFVVAEVV